MEISVILPAYNAEQYLRYAIDSILNQSFSDFELIVINDGSTDKTEDIIMSYDDPRIRYVKNEANLKLIKTLNKGIDLAKGKYIARMDADDVCLPNRLSVEYEYMEKHPEIGACSSKVIHLYPNGKTRKGKYYPSRTSVGCKYCSIFRTPLAHPASFFRSEVLKRFKYQETESALHIEATVLWGELALHDIKMNVIDERLLYYRDNENSICHSYTGLMMHNHVERVSYMLKEMLDIEVNVDLLNCIFANGNYSKNRYKESEKVFKDACMSFIEKNNCTHTEIDDIKNINRVIKRAYYYKWYKESSGLSKLYSIIKLLSNEFLINN